MKHVPIPVPDGGRIFRLAYASRARTQMERPAIVSLAADAAERNQRNSVSGVLFSGNDLFLQWLEGPADDVCSLMDRIAVDPRHTDVSILSAGWIPSRRYPSWPMQLSEQVLSLTGNDHATGEAPFASQQAMAAFDQAAEAYRLQDRMDLSNTQQLATFVESLVTKDVAQLPGLPYAAQVELSVRAQLVDDACQAFARGWHDDRWSSAEISIGLANLNCLWRRAAPSPEPVRSRACIAVVVPPDSGEILGAIVKADLLRSAGMSVQMVMEASADKAADCILRSSANASLVAGPRVGHAGDTERAKCFGEDLVALLPGVPVRMGGRANGPLRDWPYRLAWHRDRAGGLKAASVDWLAMAALAVLAKKGNSKS